MKPLSKITNEDAKIILDFGLSGARIDRIARGDGWMIIFWKRGGDSGDMYIRDGGVSIEYYYYGHRRKENASLERLRLMHHLGYDVLNQKELFDDIEQCLREADADLDGIRQRSDMSILPFDDDLEAARMSRDHIKSVYDKLGGDHR